MMIATAGARAHLLPGSALTLNDAGVLGLRLAMGDEARFMPVELLRDTPDGVLVTGLPDRADVIVRGQEYVTEGTPLIVSLDTDADTDAPMAVDPAAAETLGDAASEASNTAPQNVPQGAAQ
jgi:multidrug efflux system membrane fusion protein